MKNDSKTDVVKSAESMDKLGPEATVRVKIDDWAIAQGRRDRVFVVWSGQEIGLVLPSTDAQYEDEGKYEGADFSLFFIDSTEEHGSWDTELPRGLEREVLLCNLNGIMHMTEQVLFLAGIKTRAQFDQLVAICDLTRFYSDQPMQNLVDAFRRVENEQYAPDDDEDLCHEGSRKLEAMRLRIAELDDTESTVPDGKQN